MVDGQVLPALPHAQVPLAHVGGSVPGAVPQDGGDGGVGRGVETAHRAGPKHAGVDAGAHLVLAG